jgi:RNA polymerase sigma-70 factor (ECF subfamily)
MSLTMRQTVRLKVQSLYIDHKTWLQDWLKWKLGCIETAEDLSQDVFMRLLGRSEVVTVRRPRAYLGRIARGLVIDHWRRRDIEEAWRKLQAAVPEQAQPSPEERLEVIETLVEIDRILGTLKPRMRTAFLLARVEGMTCPCIARHLGVSKATVERDIAAALRHCYRALISQGNQS